MLLQGMQRVTGQKRRKWSEAETAARTEEKRGPEAELPVAQNSCTVDREQKEK